MIVYGFADTFNSCAQTLYGDYGRARNPKMTIGGGRRRLVAPAGGASGAFNFYGSSRFPEAEKTVTLNYDIYGVTFDEAEALAREQMDALHKKDRSKLWFVPHSEYWLHGQTTRSDGTGTVTGSVSIEGSPTDDVLVMILTANDELVASGVSAADGSYSIADVPEGTYKGRAEYWQGTTSKFTSATNASIIVVADQTTASENYTMGAASTVTNPNRWAYASLISAQINEDASRKDQNAVAVSVSFLLEEGVFYGGALTQYTLTEASATTFNAAYTGSLPAQVYISMYVIGNSMTAFRLTNNDESTYVNYGGTVAASKYLIIDTDAGTVENDGTADYANLTRASGQLPFFYLEPDSDNINSLTLTLTQAVADNYELIIRYYNTWGGV